jgi:hypothetical protein
VVSSRFYRPEPNRWQCFANWRDVDVLLSALKLTHEQTRFDTPEIELNLIEMAQSLGLRRTSQVLKQLHRSLVRWTLLEISFDHWRADDQWKNVKFTPLRRLADENLPAAWLVWVNGDVVFR